MDRRYIEKQQEAIKMAIRHNMGHPKIQSSLLELYLSNKRYLDREKLI